MPFTPFHLGPGLLFKACLQGSFSLAVFAWVQVLMDIQPGVAMLTGRGPLHGFSHTFLGSSLLALFGAWTGWLGLRWFVMREERHGTASWLHWLGVEGRLTAWVALSSAFLGSTSHVFLDAIMHADVEPWFPWSHTTDWHGLLSIPILHLACFFSGVLGIVGWLGVRAWQRRQVAV